MTVYYDHAENFHPYECDGPGKCRHCDRAVITRVDEQGTLITDHHPASCALCDPEYDHGPVTQP